METDLYYAEDDIIRKELVTLHSPSQIRLWAQQHHLLSHPLIFERLCLTCDLCDKSFNRPAKLLAHKQTKYEGIRYPCTKCHKTFLQSYEKRKHENQCSGNPTVLPTYECMICSKRCVTANGLRQHQQYSHSTNSKSLKRPTQVSIEQPAIKKPRTNPSKPAVQRFHCRRCNESFTNKRDLYLHGMQRHYQIGKGTQLQASPYGQGPYPWEIEGGENDLALKEVYEANAPLILENHREGAIHSVYNIPLTNDVNMHQLMLAADSIYQRQQHACKLTMTFVVILIYTEEKRYRFFKPYENDSVFEEPLFISKRSDLEKLRRKLTNLNLREYLMKQRPTPNGNFS
ncbi:Hypothetical predicted protein [Mytilus galloprovincialis]|uniref:C2H2-type domain-containing protein n=1 Tax=Mytilus galloprovincialis TaxID=29158 RepID=A0A8B6FHU9_MYTGA|nr:Hypothetical predicted protein [Mytilus galloprovincialis]